MANQEPKRLFDFAYYALKNHPRKDALNTKSKGIWESLSTEEYINKAVYFYKNKEEFLKLRKNLSETILSTSLFDTKKFSKNFGESLLSIFK